MPVERAGQPFNAFADANGIEGIRAAVRLLIEARDLARDAEADTWTFAVEAEELRRQGTTTPELRWLVQKKYALHQDETRRIGGKSRCFRPAPPLVFSDRTCFVLTEQGAAALAGCAAALVGTPASGIVEPKQELLVPDWDRCRRTLLLGAVIVKRFRRCAPDQWWILDAFGEEGWVMTIDDPLPPHPDMDPVRRLHDTIGNLNRNQVHPLIRFHAQAVLRRVHWERR
ncbi:MAG: hypothetical protein WD847_20695 [Pirellulales bacterium]